MNRDQRRAAKKEKAAQERAMKQGKAKGMQRAGEILSDSIDGKDSTKTGVPKKPLSLESIKQESMRLREESIKNAAKRKKEGAPKQQLIGLPLENEVIMIMSIMMAMKMTTVVIMTPLSQPNSSCSLLTPFAVEFRAAALASQADKQYLVAHGCVMHPPYTFMHPSSLYSHPLPPLVDEMAAWTRCGLCLLKHWRASSARSSSASSQPELSGSSLASVPHSTPT